MTATADRDVRITLVEVDAAMADSDQAHAITVNSRAAVVVLETADMATAAAAALQALETLAAEVDTVSSLVAQHNLHF